jgi:hypothetical protein
MNINSISSQINNFWSIAGQSVQVELQGELRGATVLEDAPVLIEVVRKKTKGGAGESHGQADHVKKLPINSN